MTEEKQRETDMTAEAQSDAVEEMKQEEAAAKAAETNSDDIAAQVDAEVVTDPEVITDDEDIAQDDPAAEASEETAEETLSPEQQMIQQLEAELAKAQSEALTQIDKQQRLAAEFQNSKKRQERQLSDAIRRASEGVVTRLLPVLDDFDLAFGNVPDGIGEEEQSWVDGFQQIQAKLTALLEDQGVTAIPRDGEFDPNLHEAITSEPSDDVESGHIIETLRVGYEFHGRVLRPAMVRVAS